MGHEVGHAFDNTGRAYDWNGAPNDWWSEASAAAYRKRADCVVRMYDGLPIAATQGGGVDGELTLGENIADLSGLKAAYNAYATRLAAFSRADRRAEEHSVRKAFGYSSAQLFFRAWAVHWCVSPPQQVDGDPSLSEYIRALSDPHAPPQWRVNIPARASDAFARAFGCKRKEQEQEEYGKDCTVF
jgi:predicted metalloendopeptidase